MPDERLLVIVINTRRVREALAVARDFAFFSVSFFALLYFGAFWAAM